MPRLILHAGTHRTGTTTIQTVMTRHRDLLRSHGLVYPETEPAFGVTHRGHHAFAHAIADTDPASRHRVDTFLSSILSDVAEDETVLLSAEAVYRHTLGLESPDDYWDARRRYLEATATALHAFDIRVVLLFRHRDTYAESLYFIATTQGFPGTFEQFLRRRRRHFDYDRQLDTFRQVFPVVDAHSFEDTVAGGLLPGFAEIIGFPALGELAAPHRHRSAGPRVALWLAGQNRHDDTDRAAVETRRHFARSPAAAELFADAARVTLWPTDQMRHRFLTRYGEPHRPNPRPPLVELDDADRTRISAAFEAWVAEQPIAPVP